MCSYDRYGPILGWTDSDMMYTAFELGVRLSPFLQDFRGSRYPQFASIYEQNDGILVGTNKTPMGGHAVAKIGSNIIDPFDGLTYSQYGEPYDRLRQRIFFAWWKN